VALSTLTVRSKAAQAQCHAASSSSRARVGNFCGDFLNVRRTTKVSGWKFDALILISNGVDSDKCWRAKPDILEAGHEQHRRGPLLGLASPVR
jgi:hypothetical protein